MKACPRCDLVYNYELLQFCRFDGTRLVKTYSGEETTQQLSLPGIPNQATGIHIDHGTGELQSRAR